LTKLKTIFCRYEDFVAKLIWSGIIFLTLFLGLALTAKSEVSTEMAIQAIIGEAAIDGEIGMTAVAEAIRNRGHLGGVYGLHRDISREPTWIWPLAETAWKNSKSSNLVKGATHWQSADDLKKTRWDTDERMIFCAKVKSHWFFKERRAVA
jgi:hypothetical protein